MDVGKVIGNTNFCVLGKALFVGMEFFIVFLLYYSGEWKALAQLLTKV